MMATTLLLSNTLSVASRELQDVTNPRFKAVQFWSTSESQLFFIRE
jgi:hypothetical protein